LTDSEALSLFSGLAYPCNKVAGGEDYLLEQTRENPIAFMTLLGKVLPTTIRGDPHAPVQEITRIEMVIVDPRLPNINVPPPLAVEYEAEGRSD
jgi:hypothetical protein